MIMRTFFINNVEKGDFMDIKGNAWTPARHLKAVGIACT